MTQSLTSTLLTTIETCEIEGWTPPFISAHLQLDNVPLSVGETFTVIISVYRNASNILPSGVRYVRNLSDYDYSQVTCHSLALGVLIFVN